jgi:hypothetical protein
MFYIAFRVPNKRTFLPGFNRERRSVYRALFNRFSKSPANEPATGSQRAPWRETPEPSFYKSFSVPIQAAPSPLRLPSKSPHRQKRSDFRALLFYLSLFPVKRAPFQISQRSPYGESWPFPEPYFTYLSDSPKKKISRSYKISHFSQCPLYSSAPHIPPYIGEIGDFCLTLLNILVSGRFWKSPIPLCAVRRRST